MALLLGGVNMDEKYMKAALKQAQKALLIDEVPIGCVIVHENKIIARSYNKTVQKKSALYHAEIIAMQKAAKKMHDWRLNECDMYVTLEPCLMCVGAIINYRIKNVYFGAYNPNGGAVISNLDISQVKGLNYSPNFVGGIAKKECGQILSDYFKKKR